MVGCKVTKIDHVCLNIFLTALWLDDNGFQVSGKTASVNDWKKYCVVVSVFFLSALGYAEIIWPDNSLELPY